MFYMEFQTMIHLRDLYFNSLNLSLDPSNFLKNDTYGLAPNNTSITVTYTIGGGITSNSPSNAVINISSMDIDNSTDGLLPEEVNLFNTVKSSLRIKNQDATTGGKGPETNDEDRKSV